jgi:hypothetical protein
MLDVRTQKNKSHHPIFLKIKPISIAKCKIFLKFVGIESKFFNLPNNEYKTPFQIRRARKMEKYKISRKINMLAISWEQCYCNKLQNQCCKHQKNFKTRYPPSSSSSIIQKVAHKPQKKFKT